LLVPYDRRATHRHITPLFSFADLVRLNVLTRRLHYWISLGIALPIAVIIGTGVLLQVKKQWSWVQPKEIRGTGTVPTIGFEEIVRAVRSVPNLDVAGWDDIKRIDIRADRGLAKVTVKGDWEVQVDLGTGKVLQSAYRRSDFLESLHDGSFFAGNWTKLGIFLPTGVALCVMWITGLWMFWLPFSVRRKRKRASETQPQSPR
jgi:uncharacterized iron-regulated membrane protein